MSRLTCNLLGDGNIWARCENPDAGFAVMYDAEHCYVNDGFVIKSSHFSQFSYYKVKVIYFRGKKNRVRRINYSSDMPTKTIIHKGEEYTWIPVRLSKEVKNLKLI